MPNENNDPKTTRTMKFVEDKTLVRVRFSESDAMGVVWHGNYLKYFEDGRESLGAKFKMNYIDVYAKGYVTPVVKIDVNYKSPLLFGEEIEVRTRFIKCQAAKIIHHYEVWNLTTNKLSCTGTSEQVFLNEKDRTLELFVPDFFKDWLESLNWREE